MTGFWNSLEPCLIFCDLPAAGQWRENYQINEAWWGECVFVCDRAYISQLHMWPSNALGEKYIRLEWALWLTLPPFSHTLSFPSSLRNRQVTLRSLLVSTISHTSSLPSLSSTSAHILHPSTSHPEAHISTKDVRQWFHTDQIRQCVSSITSHREQ